MRSRKSYKLDFNEVYPCPCRRRGEIQPIVLTEAFGCNRCQQIFVVKDDGYSLERLSNANHYPARQVWYWTGQQWVMNRLLLPHHYLLLICFTLLAIIILLLLWATVQSPMNAGGALRLGLMMLFLAFLIVLFISAVRR